MEGTIVVIGVLVVYITIERNNIEKKERKWIYSFSALAAGLSILFILPYSLNGITEFLNRYIGSITKMVIS